MPEYAYNRKYKIWYSIWRSPFNFGNKPTALSQEKAEELRNARKNKKFLIYDNRIKKDINGIYRRQRFPGIDVDYIYQDISDLKLIICNGTKYLLMYSETGCSSIGRVPISYFINNKIVDPDKQDFNVVVDYIERQAESDCHGPEVYGLSDEEKKKYLLQRAKLYYSDLDDTAKLVYNCLGHYNLEE